MKCIAIVGLLTVNQTGAGTDQAPPPTLRRRIRQASSSRLNVEQRTRKSPGLPLWQRDPGRMDQYEVNPEIANSLARPGGAEPVLMIR